MRPASGGDALTSTRTSRKSSLTHSPPTHGPVSQNLPTTFFLRSEGDVSDSPAASMTSETGSKRRQSNYGVESLADALESAFGSDRSANNDESHRDVSGLEEEPSKETCRRRSGVVERDTDDSPKRSKSFSRKENGRRQSIGRPLLSHISTTSPTRSAATSTPKSVSLQSLRLSDDESGIEESTSQAITSSGEEEEGDPLSETVTSFPQLVMPSIQMPSRRPFTTKGKAMGKLKVLVAGEAGLGKTSLLRSIVQLCEDIVHVDPLSPSYLRPAVASSQRRPQRRKSKSSGTTVVTEIHASTKAYPPWWSDEDNRVPTRRKSMPDAILERNICFVDTPGFGKSASGTEEIDLTVEYIESLLHRNATVGSMNDSDLLGVISGNGGVQVDVVIYMLAPMQDISKDIAYMQRLSSLTNVIPVIAKADTVSLSELMSIKTSILARLQTTSIKPFFFGKQIDDALLDVQGIIAASPDSKISSSPTSSTFTTSNQEPFQTPTYPYAISSTPGRDTEMMDASLLMSSDYMQPLLPSELGDLVTRIFDPDSISWLRHSAAKKFLTWRRRTLPVTDPLMHNFRQTQYPIPSVGSSVGLSGASLNDSGTASIFSIASPSGVLVPRPNSPFYLSNSNLQSNLQSPFSGSSPSLSHSHPDGLEGPTDFSLARYHNQMQREERFAEVRLAKWASDLQKSLRNERDRFEELQRSERAKWLLERMGEEVRGGNIIASPTSSDGRADWAVVRHDSGKDACEKGPQRFGKGGYDTRDPLGLCDLSDDLRRRGITLVKVLGGMSVISAVFVAVVKVSGFNNSVVWNWIVGNGD